MYPNPLVNVSDLSYLYFTRLGYTEGLRKGG